MAGTLGEEDLELRCGCGEISIRVHGGRLHNLPVDCACGDCRSTAVFSQRQKGDPAQARGSIPGYPVEALYVPNDVSVIKGQEKLAVFQLMEGHDDVRMHRVLATCCWDLLLGLHPAYRGFISSIRKGFQQQEAVPTAQLRIFTKYLVQYLDAEEIASLPTREDVSDLALLDETHPFFQGWGALSCAMEGLPGRRKGIAIEALFE